MRLFLTASDSGTDKITGADEINGKDNITATQITELLNGDDSYSIDEILNL